MSGKTQVEHDYERITQGYDRALMLMQEELNKIGAEHDALVAALRPFAAITPSSAFSDDDNELYEVILSRRVARGDFRRSDILRAKDALNAK